MPMAPMSSSCCRPRSASCAPDGAYVEQLLQTEERILRAFEDALPDAQPDVRALLAVELPKLRACHARMRQLQEARS